MGLVCAQAHHRRKPLILCKPWTIATLRRWHHIECFGSGEDIFMNGLACSSFLPVQAGDWQVQIALLVAAQLGILVAVCGARGPGLSEVFRRQEIGEADSAGCSPFVPVRPLSYCLSERQAFYWERLCLLPLGKHRGSNLTLLPGALGLAGWFLIEWCLVNLKRQQEVQNTPRVSL